MNIRWLIAALPLLLLLLLLALPARLLWSVMQSQLPAQTATQISLQGISGRWWSGQAASLLWLGQHRGQLHWRLLGPTTIALQLEHPQQQVQARLALGDLALAEQRLRLHDVSASMDAAALPELWPQVRLQGQLQAQLQQLNMQFNRQLQLQGEIRWSAARLAGAAALDLGDVSLVLQPQQDHTSVQISNQRNENDIMDIQLLGSGDLHADHYAVQLRLRPLAGRTELNQQLAWLGQRQPDGSYQLELQGTW